MRILLMTASYPPVLGGLQTVVHTLARQLRARQHGVRVVANRYPRHLAAQETVDGVSVRRCHFIKPSFSYLQRGRLDLFLASFYAYPATRRQLAQLFKSFQPDIVNIHYPDSQLPVLRRLRQRFDFRLVLSLHGHELLRWFENEDSTAAKHLAEFKEMLRSADAVTTCSDYLLNKAVELEKSVAEKGVAIHNGLDTTRFADATAYSHPRPYIFAFGRLSSQKGFDLLLAAFAQVAQIRSNLDLIIAGEGDEFESLQAQIWRLSLEQRVHLIGRASPERVVQLLNGCELAAIPSRSEPFGIVALEAMAAGKPVLATHVGGLPEFVDGPANQLVAPTVEGLKAGLENWFENRETFKSAGNCNRSKAAAFTWDKVVERYLGAYDSTSTNNCLAGVQTQFGHPIACRNSVSARGPNVAS